MKLKYILLFIYILVVILATIVLFTYNKFSSSSFGDTIITYLDRNISNYHKGDLLIVTNKNIKKGDKIIYYNTDKGKNILSFDKVKKIIKTNKNETTYVINDNVFVSSSYVLGNNVVSIGLIGYLYLFFTNTLGYFISVIIPILCICIYLMRKRHAQV